MRPSTARAARRIAFGAIAAASIALAPAVPALAADPAPTILHLNQTAEQVVARDRIVVALRAEATGADPSRAQAEVNRRMAAALAKAKTVAAVTAASGNYQTYQETPAGPDNKHKAPPQWHAVQELALTSRDFTAALDLAGQLQAEGLAIGDMRFEVAPETVRSRQQALTEEALRALTARAGQIAATLGLTVARIETLYVGNAMQPNAVPRPLMMAMRGTAAPAPPPAVAAGDATIAVTVNAQIALAPRP